MTQDQQLENFEKAFYQDGFNLAMKASEAGMKPQHISAAVQEMYNSIDNLIDSITTLAKQQERPIECKLGCEYCCHQPVFALHYELDFLNSYLQEYFDDDLLSEIKEKAKQKETKLAKLKDNELLNSKHPCPLLNDGACIAYEARPMACRIYLSSNVKTCIRFYKVPNDKNSYPALLDLPMRLGRMMNEGFKTALKMSGVVPEEFRIEERLS